jgi:hypothetical protein
MPRGRPDPLRQVPNGGRVHSVAGLEILEKDRTELDQSEGRLAPGDDGVHAGTIAVVGADAAIAITVERRGVAARAAIALTGNQIDERLFLGLLHKSLISVPGKVWLGVGLCWMACRWILTIPAAGSFRQYTLGTSQRQEGEITPRDGRLKLARRIRQRPVPVRK